MSSTDIQGFRRKARPGELGGPREFLLGYVNAYGQYTQRPLLNPDEDPRGLLPAAPDAPGRRDLGGNGSYLVFRQLSQEVGEFWKFMDEHTRAPNESANAEARVRLASKMVGRWPSGAPLVKHRRPTIPLSATTTTSCITAPGISTVRARSAPASGAPILATPSIPSPVRSVHRGGQAAPHPPARASMRRAVVESMEIADILARRDQPGERGLHFICFNTHIGRQFEFIQHTWLNNPKFDGLAEDDDPWRRSWRVAREAQAPSPCKPSRSARVTGMPRFSHVRGGGYFFMPGIRAVRSSPRCRDRHECRDPGPGRTVARMGAAACFA